jgi:hypothetical protein
MISDENKLLLVKEAAITAILKAMQRFATTEVIQERACRVLLHASMKAENIEALKCADVVGVVSLSVKNFPFAKNVTRYGKQCLKNIRESSSSSVALEA